MEFEILYPDIIVKSKRNGNSYQYNVRGRDLNCCKVCGKPNSLEHCKYHQARPNIPFNLIFGGYYEVDDRGKALNRITSIYLEMMQFKISQIVKEFVEILKIRLEREFFNVYDGSNMIATWIPSSNKLIPEIAKKIFKKFNIIYVNPEKFCSFHPQYDIKEKKYKSLNFQGFDEGLIWIIFDDVYHHGSTMNRIFNILESFNPRCFYGITLMRTGANKQVFFKFPDKK